VVANSAGRSASSAYQSPMRLGRGLGR